MILKIILQEDQEKILEGSNLSQKNHLQQLL
jgi:hypothetical protein